MYRWMIRDVFVAVSFVMGLWFQASESVEYQRGREALDRSAWQEAADAFSQIEDGDANADAALYWQAYAYNKLGESVRALELASELESRYPQSEWRDDARALTAELSGGSAGNTDDDYELKLIALNALVHTDPEQAVPILREFLSGNHEQRLKERALFVLAQSGSDEGFEILADTARNPSEPELRKKALRYMGVHNSERSLALLEELYASLPDVESRRVILQSLMIAGEKARLLDLARNEPDDELRGQAIRLLGTMSASDELWDLYQVETSETVRRRILQGFMVGGDTERLFAVARNESESQDLRQRAVQLLGTQDAEEELWSLYETANNDELKKRILHGLFLSDATDRLASVARDGAESMELREAAIHNLGITGDAARPLLLALYGQASTPDGLKNRVLHSLFIQDAAEELVEIAKAESDLERRKKAVHWLSLMDEPAAKAYMLEILKR